YPETTTADAILGLHYSLVGVRQFRAIEVIKSRASLPLPGLHSLVLAEDGASVFPQFEERVITDVMRDAATFGEADMKAQVASRGAMIERATFGLPELDAMLSGGLPSATCTLLAGSLGTGKTLLALCFSLAALRAGERVLFVGFRESRAQLV